MGPGQEKHLPHEGWHVVQQMQGRVKRTMQMKGVSINDDAGLEKEADVMGTKALQMRRTEESEFGFPIHTFASAAIKSGPVLQLKWITTDDGATYQQDVEIDGRTWEIHLGAGEDQADLYRFTEEQDTSEWMTAEEHSANGHPPPLGARFQEQRREEDQGKEGLGKYVYEEDKLDVEAPLVIKQAQRFMGEQIEKIASDRKEAKGMLDGILVEEFKKISTRSQQIKQALAGEELSEKQKNILTEHFAPDAIVQMVRSRKISDKQIENLEAGLRHKRVYEHEQNLVTINRRSRSDLKRAVSKLNEKYEVHEIHAAIQTVEDDTEIVKVDNYLGSNYQLGTLFFGDARFERVGDPLVEDGSDIYRHRGTGKEYVKDISDRFTPRFVTRSIRYEDAMALLNDEEMPTKLDYFDTISGKEASDYGTGFNEGQEIDHDQKVIGQIRGYGRFLSATTSNRLATSTSRGTYDSPFGADGSTWPK